MLDTVEDKAGFEEMLTTLDVPASAIKEPDVRRQAVAARAAGRRRAAVRAAAHRPPREGVAAGPVPAHPVEVGGRVLEGRLR
jgi:hypothetical protein